MKIHGARESNQRDLNGGGNCLTLFTEERGVNHQNYKINHRLQGRQPPVSMLKHLFYTFMILKLSARGTECNAFHDVQ